MPSPTSALRLGVLALLDAWVVAAELMKGVSYSPVPLKSIIGASQLPQDDWMSEQAGVLWGRAGRRDLEIIRSLGANAVRLYGNNPTNSHINFLDEARRLGLSVLPGMSDFPYYQQVPGGCAHSTNFNCFSQIKPQYSLNLLKGWLRPDRTYHPALKIMNIINEPDLKMPPTATHGGLNDILKMGRSIISAFDAMLDAEKDMQVVGPLINFTVTFSYAICSSCERFKGSPALGQMVQVDDAMRNPGKYGYRPKNNITEAYLNRWIHSFNTQNPATDLQGQFLNDYERFFPKTPVYIGEYHRVGSSQIQDLGMILSIANRSELFRGISFFEFQVAYWKTGSEMDFGMLGLTDDIVVQMPYFGMTYPVYCLSPVLDSAADMPMHMAVAKVYGGPGFNTSKMCVANPWAVPLDPSGLVRITRQGSVEQTARFVKRILDHLGAHVVHSEGLRSFVQKYAAATEADWPRMMGELGGPLWWTAIDSEAKCLADRTADPVKVGNAIGWACSQAKTFSCASIPTLCHRSTYTTADYVFSMLHKELGGADPLRSCSFGGAAIFAGSSLYSTWTGARECMAGGSAPDVPEPTVAPTTLQPQTRAPTTAAPTTAAPTTAAPTTAAPTTAAPTTRAPTVRTTPLATTPAPSSSAAPVPAATSAAPTTADPQAPHRDVQPTPPAGETRSTAAPPSSGGPHYDDPSASEAAQEDYASGGRQRCAPGTPFLGALALLPLAAALVR